LTPQEEQLLSSLIERINQTQLQEKDPDAEALLNQKLGPNPDALYMLAQTVLVQNIALDQAKAQVSQLQQQVQQQHPQPAHTTSFLGRLLGERDDAPQSQQSQQAPAYQPVPQYAQAQPYGQPQYAQPQYPQAQYVPVGGQPSFLRGAMQTAAGVAAGALAFEGVESILHGFGHGGSGFGGPGYGMGGFGMGERPVEETVVNNYYDQPGGGAEHGEHHMQDQGAQFNDAGNDSGAGYNPRDNDSNDNLRGFDQNAGGTNDQDTGAFADTSNLDDQSGFADQNADDGSGYDDSGSFDDGGGSFDDGGGGGDNI
jgi:uncharacterized protein